ncbi:MAG: hypothetical protein M3P18_24830 [Actinomycetota bacterium]|nr:hypothetical protein [Actinomycetota bacterium]
MRRPRTSIGWILLGIGSCFALLSVPVGVRAEQFANSTVGMPVALRNDAAQKVIRTR